MAVDAPALPTFIVLYLQLVTFDGFALAITVSTEGPNGL